MACACREAEWLRRFAEMEEKLAAAERERDEARLLVADLRELRIEDEKRWRGIATAAESRLAAATEVLREIAGEGLPLGSLPVCHRCKALRDSARAFFAQQGGEVSA